MGRGWGWLGFTLNEQINYLHHNTALSQQKPPLDLLQIFFRPQSNFLLDLFQTSFSLMDKTYILLQLHIDTVHTFVPGFPGFPRCPMTPLLPLGPESPGSPIPGDPGGPICPNSPLEPVSPSGPLSPFCPGGP